ncbi:imidazolonepropionase [Pedobacter sp. GR22-6]|uniref:imidazolonepropionase n=1 Tax=Pedobacter sp. GR22-6 TaxID=3127957 RepID=UPI00307E257A
MGATYTLIGPITQILTLSGLPDRSALKDSELEIIPQGGILLMEEWIYRIGSYESLEAEADALEAIRIVPEGDYVCSPCFVDAHTHICFAGSRANDYAMRNSGRSYLEIAEAGGGIWDTVQHTRKASLEELAALTIRRANRHLSEGVGTIEVKSGYGLNLAEELKMLRAIRLADEQTGADLVATCLAAHMLPRDYTGSRQEYLSDMATQLFPLLVKERLSTRIDAFIEKGAFSSEEIGPYFHAAKSCGFALTVHADQFSCEGSQIAVAFDALSADHLEASGDKEIELLAKSNTIPIALPGASIGLGCAFAPARRLLDAGTSLAIASDWNPGSAPMGDLLTQAAILGTFEKLSNAEVFAAITFRAAKAIGLDDRGKLEPGLLADFNLFPIADYREILYQQGKLKPAQVWKNGKLAYSSL